MRSTYLKLGFVAALVGAAFVARGSISSITNSAGIVTVTASPSGQSIQNNGTVPNGFVPTVGADGTSLMGGGGMSTTTSSPAIGVDTSVSPFTRVGDAPPPTLDYHEALVADLTSGAIFFGDHDGDRWPLASVSKLMTAVVTENMQDLNQQVMITPQMFAVDPTDATLKVGDTYTVSDLLHIMLLQSSNVAAEALASAGGRAQFLSAMNADAAALHMTNTYYADPSGLSSANESTADDLLLLAQNIYTNYAEVLAITRTPQYTVTNLATGKKITVKSINNFAGQSDFIGGKTGYTTLSDGNLLSIFKYENRPVLVIIMGTDDAARFNNTIMLYNWFKQNFK